MSSTPETATGLSTSGDDSAVPLLANRSSVPAPDDEKLSISAGIDAEGRRIGDADRAGGDRAGRHGMAKDGPGIGAADRGRQTVALGDLLDQPGIGSRQIFDGDVVSSRSG